MNNKHHLVDKRCWGAVVAKTMHNTVIALRNGMVNRFGVGRCVDNQQFPKQTNNECAVGIIRIGHRPMAGLNNSIDCFYIAFIVTSTCLGIQHRVKRSEP